MRCVPEWVDRRKPLPAAFLQLSATTYVYIGKEGRKELLLLLLPAYHLGWKEQAGRTRNRPDTCLPHYLPTFLLPNSTYLPYYHMHFQDNLSTYYLPVLLPPACLPCPMHCLAHHPPPHPLAFAPTCAGGGGGGGLEWRGRLWEEGEGGWGGGGGEGDSELGSVSV